MTDHWASVLNTEPVLGNAAAQPSAAAPAQAPLVPAPAPRSVSPPASRVWRRRAQALAVKARAALAATTQRAAAARTVISSWGTYWYTVLAFVLTVLVLIVVRPGFVMRPETVNGKKTGKTRVVWSTVCVLGLLAALIVGCAPYLVRAYGWANGDKEAV